MTNDDRPSFLDRVNTRLEQFTEDLEARNLPGDAARYLRRQARTRTQLAKAVKAWAELGHGTDTRATGPMPVTTVEARNAAGLPITVTVLVNITPGATP